MYHESGVSDIKFYYILFTDAGLFIYFLFKSILIWLDSDDKVTLLRDNSIHLLNWSLGIYRLPCNSGPFIA